MKPLKNNLNKREMHTGNPEQVISARRFTENHDQKSEKTYSGFPVLHADSISGNCSHNFNSRKMEFRIFESVD